MKDKTQNKNIFQVSDQKNPTPCPFPKGPFMYVTLFLFVCLGFYRYWDFLICFQGGFLGGKFLKMEAFSKPPPPTPVNLFAFFFKKKKKDKKKKNRSPAVCLYPSPSTRKAIV